MNCKFFAVMLRIIRVVVIIRPSISEILINISFFHQYVPLSLSLSLYSTFNQYFIIWNINEQTGIFSMRGQRRQDVLRCWKIKARKKGNIISSFKFSFSKICEEQINYYYRRWNRIITKNRSTFERYETGEIGKFSCLDSSRNLRNLGIFGKNLPFLFNVSWHILHKSVHVLS